MHEHEDHPTFLAPVTVEYLGTETPTWDGPDGPIAMTPEEVRQFKYEEHALIYTDGTIAVTLFEHCYAMWNARTGSLMHGSLWNQGEWRMTADGIKVCADAASEIVDE